MRLFSFTIFSYGSQRVKYAQHPKTLHSAKYSAATAKSVFSSRRPLRAHLLPLCFPGSVDAFDFRRCTQRSPRFSSLQVSNNFTKRNKRKNSMPSAILQKAYLACFRHSLYPESSS